MKYESPVASLSWAISCFFPLWPHLAPLSLFQSPWNSLRKTTLKCPGDFMPQSQQHIIVLEHLFSRCLEHPFLPQELQWLASLYYLTLILSLDFTSTPPFLSKFCPQLPVLIAPSTSCLVLFLWLCTQYLFLQLPWTLWRKRWLPLLHNPTVLCPSYSFTELVHG